jgi:protein-disulfide isomerase
VSEKARRKRLLQFASAAVFLVVIALAVVIVLVGANGGSGGDTKLEGTAAVARELKGIPQRGMVLGDPAAKVTLVEFGDLQCPVCAAYSEGVVAETIDSKVRSGEAKVEFRNYTIISQESVPAGAAAIAAGMQGRGWSYVDLFYRNQGTEASGYVTDAFLTEIARGAGVADVARWNRDRHARATLDAVAKTTEEARQLGFEGTPSFAVDGPGTEGLRTLGFPESAGDLEAAIEEAA